MERQDSIGKIMCHNYFSLTLHLKNEKKSHSISLETSIVFKTLLTITELTHLNIFPQKNPPWVPSMIVSNQRSQKWSNQKIDTTYTNSVFHNQKICCLVEKYSFTLKVPKMYFFFSSGPIQNIARTWAQCFVSNLKKDKVHFQDLQSEGIFFNQATNFLVMKN